VRADRGLLAAGDAAGADVGNASSSTEFSCHELNHFSSENRFTQYPLES
jgi:hypothetical protein